MLARYFEAHIQTNRNGERLLHHHLKSDYAEKFLGSGVAWRGIEHRFSFQNMKSKTVKCLEVFFSLRNFTEERTMGSIKTSMFRILKKYSIVNAVVSREAK